MCWFFHKWHPIQIGSFHFEVCEKCSKVRANNFDESAVYYSNVTGSDKNLVLRALEIHNNKPEMFMPYEETQLVENKKQLEISYRETLVERHEKNNHIEIGRIRRAEMTFHEAANTVMPKGKFKGQSVGNIAKTDDGLKYLDWAIGAKPFIGLGFDEIYEAIEIYLSDPAISDDLERIV